ncbi:mannosyltransferase [Rhizobium sp. TRM95111]|uniref:glycosyltransferase family 32 protein n=1 Tax=Rhizobium alarense TaxID=2846851 RepID=UPI001F445E35|nr:glycosyltransferase [Rhizobium alarense]MCF3640497.1 mannosyltransferase [Rhizobium alarense]
MESRQQYRAAIAGIRSLIDTRAYDEARARLDDMARTAVPAAHDEVTLLGLPRKVHSLFLKLAKAEGDAVARAGYQYTMVPPAERIAGCGRPGSEERRAIARANAAPVPRLIHQIWIGDGPVPPATQAWARHAARHGYAYRLWREADLRRLGLEDDPVFAGMLATRDFPGAVDVARYFILREEGGLYLDCDWYPARDDIAFHDVLPLVGLTVLDETIPRQTPSGSLLLANSFIAAPPRHPVFERLVAVLPEVWRAMPLAPAWWSTGPLVFTVCCRTGSVTLADAALVAGSLPRLMPFEAVERLRDEVRAADGGLLIAWKSW